MFYFPQTSSIDAICLLHSRPKDLPFQIPFRGRVTFYQKMSEMNIFQAQSLYKKCFSISQFEENNFNRMFCLSQSRLKDLPFQIPFRGRVTFYQKMSEFNIFQLQSLYSKSCFANSHFEASNFNRMLMNVVLYFPQTSSIDAICLLHSRPKDLPFQIPFRGRVTFYQKMSEMNIF